MPLFGENETKSSVDGEKCRWQWLEQFFMKIKKKNHLMGESLGNRTFWAFVLTRSRSKPIYDL